MLLRLHLDGFYFFFDGQTPSDIQKLELVLLSYDNISWVGTRKRLDTKLLTYKGIYVNNGKIHAFISLRKQPNSDLILDLKSFIKNY